MGKNNEVAATVNTTPAKKMNKRDEDMTSSSGSCCTGHRIADDY